MSRVWKTTLERLSFKLLLVFFVLAFVITGCTLLSAHSSISPGTIGSRADPAYGNLTVLGLNTTDPFDGKVEVSLSADDLGNISEVSYLVDGEVLQRTTVAPYTFTMDTFVLDDGEHTLEVVVDYQDGGTTSVQQFFSSENHDDDESQASQWFRKYIGASGGMMTCMMFLIANRIRQFIFGVGAQFGEEQLKERTKGAVIAAATQAGPFSRFDFVLMFVGLGALGLAFGYSTMMGDIGASPLRLGGIPTIYPNFETVGFLTALPVALLCGGVLIVGSEVVEWSAAKKKGHTAHLTLWPIGLASLAISSFLFLIPFGYPVKVKVSNQENMDPKDRGELSLSVALFLGSMLLPFAILAVIPFTELLGVIGISLTIMLFCYTLVPIKPLEGRFIFKWNKPLWFVMFFSSMGMFVAWSVFQSFAIIFGGIGVAAGVGLVLLFLKGGGAEKEKPDQS